MISYSRDVTVSHSINTNLPNGGHSGHLWPITNIFENEKEGTTNPSIPLFTQEQVAWRLDAIAKRKMFRKDKTLATMDMAVGILIKEADDFESRSLCGMLLVELKFNSKNPANLDTNNLCKKITDSQTILGETPPIYPEYIFIFHPQYHETAKDFFFDLSVETGLKMTAMDECEFHQSYFV